MRRETKPVAWLALAIGLSTVAPAASASILIHLEGVAGTSTERAHRGWVEAESVEFPSATRVAFSKRHDASSDVLIHLAISGRRFANVEIDIADQSGRAIFIYYLTDATLLGVQPGGPGDVGPERVTIRCANLTQRIP